MQWNKEVSDMRKEVMMNNRKRLQLKDICNKSSSNIAQKDVAGVNGTFPIYGASGFIKNVDFYHQGKEYVGIVKDGAGVGRAMLLPKQSSVIGTLQYILPKANVLPQYLYYILTSMDLAKYATGATIPHIYFKDYSSEKVFLPSICKQREIVDTLNKATELITLRKRQLEELDALAEALFYYMFGDPVKNEKEWKICSLKKVCSKIGSGATPKGGNANYKSCGISLIRSLNVYNGRFQRDGLAYIDDTQANSLNNVTVHINDVLLNITGASVARCCVVPQELLPARVNQHVAIIRVSNELNYIYLVSVLTSLSYQQKLLRLSKSNGATREALTKTDIENFQIPLPPISLQTQFATVVERIEEQKSLVRKALKDSEDLFQRLMQDLLNPD